MSIRAHRLAGNYWGWDFRDSKGARIIIVSVEFLATPPPLLEKGVEQGGGFATENMLSPEIAKIPQKFFAPSARFLVQNFFRAFGAIV